MVGRIDNPDSPPEGVELENNASLPAEVADPIENAVDLAGDPVAEDTSPPL